MPRIHFLSEAESRAEQAKPDQGPMFMDWAGVYRLESGEVFVNVDSPMFSRLARSKRQQRELLTSLLIHELSHHFQKQLILKNWPDWSDKALRGRIQVLMEGQAQAIANAYLESKEMGFLIDRFDNAMTEANAELLMKEETLRSLGWYDTELIYVRSRRFWESQRSAHDSDIALWEHFKENLPSTADIYYNRKEASVSTGIPDLGPIMERYEFGEPVRLSFPGLLRGMSLYSRSGPDKMADLLKGYREGWALTGTSAEGRSRITTIQFEPGNNADVDALRRIMRSHYLRKGMRHVNDRNAQPMILSGDQGGSTTRVTLDIRAHELIEIMERSNDE